MRNKKQRLGVAGAFIVMTAIKVCLPALRPGEMREDE